MSRTYRPDNNGKPWTPALEDELRRLALMPGATYRSIAQALYRTPVAVEHQMHKLGIRLAKLHSPAPDPLDGIFLNGEPLQFAETDRPCARCAVRESVHPEHGCGQFAAEVRVRIR